MLINPKEILIGCPFADFEHVVIVNLLNATAKLSQTGKRKRTVEVFLPTLVNYLNAHLTHEEKITESAVIFWAEERELEGFLEKFLTERDNVNDIKQLGEWLSRINPPKEVEKVVKLLVQQRFSHKNIISVVENELSKINPESSPKRIVEQLGILSSFLINRITKTDKKFKEFFEEYGLPACRTKPLEPPDELLKEAEEILGGDFLPPPIK